MQGVHQLLCRLPPAGHGDILLDCVCIYIYVHMLVWLYTMWLATTTKWAMTVATTTMATVATLLSTSAVPSTTGKDVSVDDGSNDMQGLLQLAATSRNSPTDRPVTLMLGIAAAPCTWRARPDHHCYPSPLIIISCLYDLYHYIQRQCRHHHPQGEPST